MPRKRMSRVACALLTLLSTCCICVRGSGEPPPTKLPSFPDQFSATLVTIAHQVDKTRDYPPWKQVLHIDYDFPGGRARINATEGFHAGKLFLRRYDTKREYMIRGGDFAECQRSYLGEDMPKSTVRNSPASFQGWEVLPDGPLAEHWVEDRGRQRLHIYITGDGGQRVPYQLIDEYLANGKEGQLSEPVMTYTFHNMSVSEPAETAFGLPTPYSHKTCNREIGGQPYLHLFSAFLMV